MKVKFVGRVLAVWLSITALPAMSGTILVLGDSISAGYGIALETGWVNLLRERLEENHPGRFRVVNASISGDTTAGGLQRLPPLLDKHAPDKVIVALGGNDGLRGLSLKEMESNLETIIAQCKEQGAEVVMVGIELPSNYGATFNRRFQQVYQTVAKRMAVPMIPLGFGLLNDRSLLQEDGIHPTAAAQGIILDEIWPAINGGEGAKGKDKEKSAKGP